MKVGLFDDQLDVVTIGQSLNDVVERCKLHIQNMAKFIGINHDIHHEFNISPSSRFRGYSAKMDDRSAINYTILEVKFSIGCLTVGWLI